MSHLPNWKEYGAEIGPDKPKKDPTEVHDATYGSYKCNVLFKMAPPAYSPLPVPPKPFKLR